MKSAIRLLLVPVLGAGAVGIYYSETRYYVQDAYGGYINNYELFKDLNLSGNSYQNLIGFNDKITDHYYSNYGQVTNTEGQKRIKVIEDYSVKLVTRCGSGTGWFLDFIIPEGNKYPTKWFIATNAHVIQDWKFKDNPYGQILPISGSLGGCVIKGETNTPLFIFKETSGKNNVNAVPIEKSPEYWNNDLIKYLSRHERIAAFDASVNYLNDKKRLIFAKVLDPKLFYAPINFLGDKYKSHLGFWIKDNYYKDFAVIEVDFGDENTAKVATDNFYEKFKSEGYLNLFSPELTKLSNGNQLNKREEDYFVAGYPANSYNAYRSFGNYSTITNRASKLAYIDNYYRSEINDYISIRNQYGEKIIGHVDVGAVDRIHKNTSIMWGGQTYNNWGYNYLLDHMDLSSGASGSIVTNSKGEVLGLYRMHDSYKKQGFVEPLRSEGVHKNKKIIYPKYDLINGSQGQIGSYREQLMRYYSSYKTFLKSKFWEK